MVEFPSWLNGLKSKPVIRLPKIKKCPSCGNISIEVAVDKESNYRCLLCGEIVSEKINK